jgi:divalent metal cation (Fe/Co/Zn/Cd) transporter
MKIRFLVSFANSLIIMSISAYMGMSSAKAFGYTPFESNVVTGLGVIIVFLVFIMADIFARQSRDREKEEKGNK